MRARTGRTSMTMPPRVSLGRALATPCSAPRSAPAEAQLDSGLFFGSLVKPPRGQKVMAADLAVNASLLHALVSYMPDKAHACQRGAHAGGNLEKRWLMNGEGFGRHAAGTPFDACCALHALLLPRCLHESLGRLQNTNQAAGEGSERKGCNWRRPACGTTWPLCHSGQVTEEDR